MGPSGKNVFSLENTTIIPLLLLKLAVNVHVLLLVLCVCFNVIYCSATLRCSASNQLLPCECM